MEENISLPDDLEQFLENNFLPDNYGQSSENEGNEIDYKLPEQGQGKFIRSPANPCVYISKQFLKYQRTQSYKPVLYEKEIKQLRVKNKRYYVEQHTSNQYSRIIQDSQTDVTLEGIWLKDSRGNLIESCKNPKCTSPLLVAIPPQYDTGEEYFFLEFKGYPEFHLLINCAPSHHKTEYFTIEFQFNQDIYNFSFKVKFRKNLNRNKRTKKKREQEPSADLQANGNEPKKRREQEESINLPMIFSDSIEMKELKVKNKEIFGILPSALLKRTVLFFFKFFNF